MKKPNYNWFEERVHEIFKKIQESSKPDSSLPAYLLKAYQIILYGDVEKNKYGYDEKVSEGLYQAQEFSTFELYFESFSALYESLKEQDNLTDYFNTYFLLGLVITDGFDFKKFEKICEDIVLENGLLGIAEKELIDANLPSGFYQIVLDYKDRIAVEISCEGKVITPQAIMRNNMISAAKKIENDQFNYFFPKLLQKQGLILNDLIKQRDYKNFLLFLKCRYEWFSRLQYLEKDILAEQYSDYIEEWQKYLLYCPRDLIEDLGLLEEVEKIIFPAIISKSYKTFAHFTQHLSFYLTILNQDSDIKKAILRNRIILLIGAFTLVYGELNNESSLILNYISIIRKMYKDGHLHSILEVLSDARTGNLDLTFKIIDKETMQYSRWFNWLWSKIDQLPKTTESSGGYGFTQIVQHNSDVIKSVSRHAYSVEETCIEEFISYVEKIERNIQHEKLLKILSQIKR